MAIKEETGYWTDAKWKEVEVGIPICDDKQEFIEKKSHQDSPKPVTSKTKNTRCQFRVF